MKTHPRYATKRLALCSLLVLLACGGGDGPSSPRTNCTNIAGTWVGTYANSCGGVATGNTAIAQSGCNTTLQAEGVISAQGEIVGNSISFTATDARCTSSTFHGTATIHSSRSITGTYSGTSNGTFGCCPAGNVSGSFTLTR